MDGINSYLSGNFAGEPWVKSVLAVENPNKITPLVDGYDLLLLVITLDSGQTNYISHYIKDNFRIQERRVTPEALETWVLIGENRNIIH